MKHKTSICLSFFVALIFCACSKDNSLVSQNETAPEEQTAAAVNNSRGATQISGIGLFDATDACNSAGQGAVSAVTLTGDLQGCWYFFVDEFECSPSGTYRELGRDFFVGTYKGQSGTFWTTYRFEAKYEGCAQNGAPLGLEIFGRCQHPIVEGTGTGVFEGVRGRVDFKDDIEAGNYPYRGHLQW